MMKRVLILALIASLVFPSALEVQAAGPKAPPEFDITSFDATPNDDTDDTAKIQDCIDAAEAQAPAIIHIPRGVYTISSPLSITADGITLRGEGTIQTNDGNTTMTSMIDVTGDDFTCELIKIDGNNAGAGDAAHCLRVAGRNNRIRGVECYNPLDTCFQVHTGSHKTTIEDCKAIGGLLSVRVNGDRCYVNRVLCKDFTGEKAIIVDPQIADAQFCSITSCTFETESDNWECAVLFDTADGGLVNNSGGTQIIECGVATSVNGKAHYTIAAGHGYKEGDMFRIGDSTISKWDRQHKILHATGDLFARRLSATTFALYTTAAYARNTDSTTGRVNLVDNGTQAVDFYCTTPIAGLMTIDEEAIDYTNDILTTTETDPGVQTGEPVRVTPHSRLHVLPGGIQDGGGVLLNSDYVSAGSADTGYFRPKRLVTAICTGHNLSLPNVMKNDANAFKFNNVNNVLLAGNLDTKPLTTTVEDPNGAGTSDDEYYEFQSVRFGANVREATILNCTLSGGIIVNALSGVGDLIVENVTLGDGYALQAYGIKSFYALRSKFRNVKFHATSAAIEYAMPDSDLESMEFDACRLIADNSTDAVQWLAPQTNVNDTFNGQQLYEAGKIFFRKNNRATNWNWGGTTVTFANAGDEDAITFRLSDGVTATNHCLTSGDLIWFEGNDLPSNLVEGTLYGFRSTGNNTGKLYTTSQAAASTALDNEIDIGDDGSGTILAFSPVAKLGINPTGAGTSNLLMRCVGSPWELEDVVSTNASSSSLQLRQGMRIWNTNVHSGSTLRPGWTVTAEGLRGSTGATVANMPAVTP